MDKKNRQVGENKKVGLRQKRVRGNYKLLFKVENQKGKVRGLGNIVLTGDTPKPDMDYLISLRVALEKIEKDVQDKENPVYTFIFRYINTEQILELQTGKKIEARKGRSQSQMFHWECEKTARTRGIEPEIYYQDRMNELISQEKSKNI